MYGTVGRRPPQTVQCPIVSELHVLIVNYWFPPAVGAAAERMVAFAQYLAEHDWRVSVLCAAHGVPPEIPGVDIFPVDDPLKKDAAAFADYDPRIIEPSWKSFARRFVFPDRFVKWKAAATARLEEIQQHLDVPVVLASFPPASAATLGQSVAATLNAPLVLDFRDRWLGPGGYAPDNVKQRAKHEALERECIQAAAGVITVSENMANAVMHEHALPPERVAVVRNGYFPDADERDEESQKQANASIEKNNDGTTSDSSGARPVTAPNTIITIAHVGTVIERNHPDRFLALLQRLQKNTEDLLQGVRFNFVGNLSRDYVASLGLSNLVTTTGLVQREQARRAMRDASALLLLVGDYVGQWGHNAKIFEYVQTGRPILCIEATPASNDGQLLRQFVPDRSFFADFEDPKRLQLAITELRKHALARPHAALELGAGFRAYSRREQTRQLSDFLKAIRDFPPITARV